MYARDWNRLVSYFSLLLTEKFNCSKSASSNPQSSHSIQSLIKLLTLFIED